MLFLKHNKSCIKNISFHIKFYLTNRLRKTLLSCETITITVITITITIITITIIFVLPSFQAYQDYFHLVQVISFLNFDLMSTPTLKDNHVHQFQRS